MSIRSLDNLAIQEMLIAPLGEIKLIGDNFISEDLYKYLMNYGSQAGSYVRIVN